MSSRDSITAMMSHVLLYKVPDAALGSSLDSAEWTSFLAALEDMNPESRSLNIQSSSPRFWGERGAVTGLQ